MQRRDKKLLTEALDLLTPIEKSCLLLHVLGNLTYREISQISVTPWPKSKMAVYRVISKAKRKAKGGKNG